MRAAHRQLFVLKRIGPDHRQKKSCAKQVIPFKKNSNLLIYHGLFNIIWLTGTLSEPVHRLCNLVCVIHKLCKQKTIPLKNG